MARASGGDGESRSRTFIETDDGERPYSPVGKKSSSIPESVQAIIVRNCSQAHH